MKLFKRLLGILTGIIVLPAFMVVGVVVAALLLRFVYWPVDETDPPAGVTVLGDWRLADGERYCRPFLYRELMERLDTLDVRFRLSSADLERCREDLADYHDAGEFRHVLHEAERGDPSYWFSVRDSLPDLALEVTRSLGDDTFTATRYRVRSDGSIDDLSSQSASAGAGVTTLVFGALAGAVLWLFWAMGRVARAFTNRHPAPPPEPVDE